MTRHAAGVNYRPRWWALLGADTLVGLLGLTAAAQAAAPRVDSTPITPPTETSQTAEPVLQSTPDPLPPSAALTSGAETGHATARPAPRVTRPPATTANRATPRTTGPEPAATTPPPAAAETTTPVTTAGPGAPASTTTADPTTGPALPTDLPIPTEEIPTP